MTFYFKCLGDSSRSSPYTIRYDLRAKKRGFYKWKNAHARLGGMPTTRAHSRHLGGGPNSVGCAHHRSARGVVPPLSPTYVYHRRRPASCSRSCSHLLSSPHLTSPLSTSPHISSPLFTSP